MGAFHRNSLLYRVYMSLSPPANKPTPPPPRRLPPDDGHWSSALILPALAVTASTIIGSGAALTIALTAPPVSELPSPSAMTRTRSAPDLGIAARLGSTAHAPFLATLRAHGYTGYVARPGGTTVLYSDPALPEPDRSLALQPRSRSSLIISGTFTAGDYQQSVGPIIRNGLLDTEGVRKAAGRGGIAIYDDGTVAIGRAKGSDLASIHDAYYRPGRTVTSYMGGGALIVELHQPVSSFDLGFRQRFNQGGFGLDATQFRRTSRAVLGIRDGYCFVLVARSKTGEEIQRDLVRAGFESAVIFDGGSGLFVNDRAGGAPAYRGRNTTGLRITKWGVI